MKPSLSDIQQAVATKFNIRADDVYPHGPSKTHAMARHLAVFLASEAGYSNAEIAEGFKYKNSGHVSGIFNRTHQKFRFGDNGFHELAYEVAKHLRIDLPQ